MKNKLPPREHPIVKELHHYWSEAFHQYSLNPKDRESEDFYHLAKTAAQFAFILEHLRLLTKENGLTHTSQHIERELNVAYRSIMGDKFEEYEPRERLK